MPTLEASSFASARLISQLATATTTGVTLQANRVNGSFITFPTGAFYLTLVRKTETEFYVEVMKVASGTTQNSTTGVVTLGTLTRNLSLTNGDDTTGTSATVTWPSGTLCYVGYGVHEVKNTAWTDTVNTFSLKQTFSVPQGGAVYATSGDLPAASNGDHSAYVTADGLFYDYIGGSWQQRATGTTANGSTTVAGKFEEATVAEQGSATATGATGARLVPAVANLVKTSSGSGDENKLPVLGSGGKLASGFIPSGVLSTTIALTPNIGVPGTNYGCAAVASDNEMTTIAFDAVSTLSATASTHTISHTCTGSNRVLMVGFYHSGSASDECTGVTYAGVQMTRIATATVGTERAYLYGLANPASGANNIVISLSNSRNTEGVNTSYTGASGLRLPDATNTNTATGATSISAATTTVGDNAWVVGFIRNNIANFGSYTGTARSAGRNNTMIDSGPKTPAGSVTLTGNWSGAGNGIIITGAIAPVYYTTSRVFDFDASVLEIAEWQTTMPSNYSGGTVTAKIHWKAATGAGDVVWAVQGYCFTDDEAMALPYGTPQSVTDTLLATGDEHQTAATSAITLGGTPGAGKLAFFRVYRDAASASDTLNADARLLAVEITYS